mmetsp:Transcript_37445/g.63062  ORF Transcript_37445/g.63062 Transcript_37445/m.63062 type:complete len:99 (-) Transcript_37445:666-962(-)
MLCFCFDLKNSDLVLSVPPWVMATVIQVKLAVLRCTLVFVAVPLRGGGCPRIPTLLKILSRTRLRNSLGHSKIVLRDIGREVMKAVMHKTFTTVFLAT